MSKVKAEVKVDEKVAADVNAASLAPLHEAAPVSSGEAIVCPADGKILAIKKPGEPLRTMGGEQLDKVPECPGVEAKEHGPIAHEGLELATVVMDKARGVAVRGRRVG